MARADGGGRIAVLDGLRCLAALMVVAFHYVAFPAAWDRPTWEIFGGLYLPASYGWLGVELFFMISGFVICMSAMDRGLGSFFMSRVVRLYPAYWFAVLATTAVLATWPAMRKPAGPSDVLLNLTMLQRPLGVRSVDAVYWTLWAELRFYLLFAIVIWFGTTYRNILIFCGLWIVAGLFAPAADNQAFTLLAMPDQAPYFVAGVAFYLMYRYGQNFLLWGIVGMTWLIAQHYLVPAHHQAEKNLHRTMPVVGTLGLLVAFYVVMALIANRKLSVSWRWLAVAGAVTYPLYLLHEYIGWVVLDALQDDVPALVLVIGLTAAMVLAAWLVHRFIERPVARWMKRALTGAMARRPDATPARRGPDPAPPATPGAGEPTVAPDAALAGGGSLRLGMFGTPPSDAPPRHRA